MMVIPLDVVFFPFTQIPRVGTIEIKTILHCVPIIRMNEHVVFINIDEISIET